MKKVIYGIVTILLLSVLTACGSNEEDNNGVSAATKPGNASAGEGQPASGEHVLGSKPLKLTFYSTSGTLPDTEFKTLIADPIHAKYPNVTIERITPAATTTAEEVLTTHEPDIIYSTSTTHQQIIRTGAYEDLRDLIDKYQFDTSRIKPILWNYIKDLGKNGEIYAIPFNSNQHVLYYNKDIFDKFGVEYPPNEQLTWDQVLEIAKKLTRTDNGVHYVGLSVDNLTGLAKGLGLPYLDRETGNAAIDTPEWHRIFDLEKQIFDIPGYVSPDGVWDYGRDQFMKDQTVAMRVTWLANMVGPLEELRQQGVEFNWDIAPAPNFEDQLGKTREAQIQSLSINSQSKHKEEAFQVIAEILSDDGQRILSRNGRVPAITNPDLEKEYGLDIPVLQGKTVQNVFVGEPLQEHYFHPYENDISVRLTEAAEDLAIHGLDVNSAIRKATDAINKDVESLRQTIGQ
ncbi:ABC transporter substrate-binding protein [Paenibacillus protaetiae]|uniref:Extracellular solute-binding protein n=1 Tax=Paenibacillus protaetiae TaxID=2509456 RepID=A0A4P6F4N8_9BACL|nr:extracellular solute-binding protein [Paenibacillus protaetiae]QAY65358.1 extracellular solute-binding protein [Paenibacillus protaetiae]